MAAGGGKLFYDVKVEPGASAADLRLDAVEREIAIDLPGSDVHLTRDADTIFIRGHVKDMTSADRAYAIASVLGKAVNLLYVDVPASEPQILLKVRFASIDRNLSDQLGLNLFSTGATNTIGSVSTQQFSPPLFGTLGPNQQTSTTLSDALNLFLFRPDLNLGATISALQSKGLLEILAEPNVLTQSGQAASFLAGGEFPFPVVQGSSGGGATAVTIQFREFGVRLNFVPTLTPRGGIVLRVAPEVSALDFTHGLTVNGFNVPALSVRKLSTVVELKPGESFAIGGLLDRRVTDTLEKVPFIGDLPVLGKLFQSRSRTKENTELLVIVTPELVQPMGVGEPPLNLKFPADFLPTDGLPQSGLSESGRGTPAPDAPPSLPVEKLLKSLQATEQNLQSKDPGAAQAPVATASPPPKP